MTPQLHVCIVPSKLTSETESKNAGCFSIAQNNKAEFCILEQGQAEHSVACYDEATFLGRPSGVWVISVKNRFRECTVCAVGQWWLPMSHCAPNCCSAISLEAGLLWRLLRKPFSETACRSVIGNSEVAIAILHFPMRSYRVFALGGTVYSFMSGWSKQNHKTPASWWPTLMSAIYHARVGALPRQPHHKPSFWVWCRSVFISTNSHVILRTIKLMPARRTRPGDTCLPSCLPLHPHTFAAWTSCTTSRSTYRWYPLTTR